jgi:tryptophan halogenase
LIQSAIVRLIHLFPHAGVTTELMNEYNRQSKTEYELIRDFIIMHYYLNERDDSQFWRDLRNMDVPDRLKQKIELFRSNGGLVQDQLDIFLESSWLQVMLGQGVIPQDYHPIADGLTDKQLVEKLANTKKLKMEPLPKIPSHDQFLKMFCKNG